MTQEEMKAVAEEAAMNAIHRFLLVLGVDAEDPKSLLELQADLAHLRVWRKSVTELKRVGLGAAITTVTTGVLALLWMKLQFWK